MFVISLSHGTCWAGNSSVTLTVMHFHVSSSSSRQQSFQWQSTLMPLYKGLFAINHSTVHRTNFGRTNCCKTYPSYRRRRFNLSVIRPAWPGVCGNTLTVDYTSLGKFTTALWMERWRRRGRTKTRMQNWRSRRGKCMHKKWRRWTRWRWMWSESVCKGELAVASVAVSEMVVET